MRPRIELFCEDSAHESFARALVARLANEVGVSVTLRVATARFGIPRVKQELRAFQAVVAHRAGSPDLLIVLVDANRVGPQARRQEVGAIVDGTVFPRWIIGTPDPCIERWLLADPTSFVQRFGTQPDISPVTKRSEWKKRLVAALEQAGEIVVQGWSGVRGRSRVSHGPLPGRPRRSDACVVYRRPARGAHTAPSGRLTASA